jgi:hypothetical protein
MAKKSKSIYAPGELGRVRDRLGNFNPDEAKQLAQKLGGEVGYERSEDEEKTRAGIRRTRHEKVNVQIGNSGRSSRRVELPPELENETGDKKQQKQKGYSPADDPRVPIKASYWERVKMDRYAGQPEFEIKTAAQVLFSMISVFADIADSVNPVFVTRRMQEYYKKI